MKKNSSNECLKFVTKTMYLSFCRSWTIIASSILVFQISYFYIESAIESAHWKCNLKGRSYELMGSELSRSTVVSYFASLDLKTQLWQLWHQFWSRRQISANANYTRHSQNLRSYSDRMVVSRSAEQCCCI